jgi:hypothetical protein
MIWADASHVASFVRMASTFMTLHVAAHAEGLSAALVRTLEGLLAGVRMRMDAQAGRSRKCFIAGLANIAILRLWERSCGRGRDIVMVLPWVGAR